MQPTYGLREVSRSFESATIRSASLDEAVRPETIGHGRSDRDRSTRGPVKVIAFGIAAQGSELKIGLAEI